MRRLVILLLFINLKICAQYDVVLHSNNQEIYSSSISKVEDIKTSGNLTVYLNDKTNVSFPISIIDSLTFEARMPKVNTDFWKPMYIQTFPVDVEKGELWNSDANGHFPAGNPYSYLHEGYTLPLLKGNAIGEYKPNMNGLGWYYPNETLSIKNGSLFMEVLPKDVSDVNGKVKSGHINLDFGVWDDDIAHGDKAINSCLTQIRLRVTQGSSGAGFVHLLWPNDGVWPASGEADWPEADGNMSDGNAWWCKGYHHYADGVEPYDQDQIGNRNKTFLNTWHIAEIEWVGDEYIEYRLDGNVVFRTTDRVIPRNTDILVALQSGINGDVAPTGKTVIEVSDWNVYYAPSKSKSEVN